MRDDADLPSLFPPRLDDEAGPARRLSEDETDALVAEAMRACGVPIAPQAAGNPAKPPVVGTSGEHRAIRRSEFPEEEDSLDAPLGLRVASRPPRSASRRLVPVAVIGAAMAFGTGAAAALSGSWLPAVQQWASEWVSGGQEQVEETAKTAAPTLRKRAPGIELAPSEIPVAPSSNPRASGAAPPQEVEHARKRADAEQAQVASAQPRATAPHQDSKPEQPDLLSVANSLRAQRRYHEALQNYTKIVARGGGGRQVVAARTAAATLLLDHQNDAKGAMRMLAPITESSRALPEAVFLLARAQAAAGERSAAVRTLRRFTAQHGDHPLAQRAKHRLEQLSGTAD